MRQPEKLSTLLPKSLMPEPQQQPDSTPTAPPLPAVGEQTYEQALAGKAGLDYLPDDACAICGRMPHFNGRRYVFDHDAEKHIAGEPQRAVTEAGQVVNISERLARATAGVRRTTGERDDDD